MFCDTYSGSLVHRILVEVMRSLRCSGSGEDGNAIFRTGVEPTEREANDLDEATKPKVRAR